MTAALYTVPAWHMPAPAAKADTMRAQAARLYPDSDYLQAEWVRAVRVVRSTSAGWLLDRRQGRKS